VQIDGHCVLAHEGGKLVGIKGALALSFEKRRLLILHGVKERLKAASV
jgi:hypothetical protein